MNHPIGMSSFLTLQSVKRGTDYRELRRSVSAPTATPTPARMTLWPEPTPRGSSGRVSQGRGGACSADPAACGARHIAKARRNNPAASPAEVIAALDKHYLDHVGGTVAAAGGAAFFPGSAPPRRWHRRGRAIAALDAAVLYTWAVAEVHGLRDRRGSSARRCAGACDRPR